jgi:hydroxyacylglutathione hydrolase
MKYQRFILGPLETNGYVLWDPSGEAALVDPVVPAAEIFEFLDKGKLSVRAILITHSHVDHLHGAEEAARRFDVPIYMHSAAEKLREFYEESCVWLGFEPRPMPKGYLPADKTESIRLGEEELRFITTPGHSPCGISLAAGAFVVTGDLLFKGCIGRYDLPFASLPLLYQSLKKIKTLSPALEVLPGHGPLTTLDLELRTNEYLLRLP